MRSSNLGALLAAGSREAANTAQEDSGDPAGGVGTSDPQPRLQDSHTHHPAPRGHFLSTSPGLGSRSGLGDAREQGTRVPTCPRGPAQRGSSDHSLGGWGVWRGSGPSPPVTVGPPGGGLLARCPLRWTLACMGRHLFALSLRPARVTSPELSAWWVLVASPWDSSGRGPPRGRGDRGLASRAGVKAVHPPATPRCLPVAQGPSVHQAGRALCTGPAVWGGRPVPQGLTPSCCW